VKGAHSDPWVPDVGLSDGSGEEPDLAPTSDGYPPDCTIYYSSVYRKVQLNRCGKPLKE